MLFLVTRNNYHVSSESFILKRILVEYMCSLFTMIWRYSQFASMKPTARVSPTD